MTTIAMREPVAPGAIGQPAGRRPPPPSRRPHHPRRAAYRSAMRALGLALTADDPGGWDAARFVLPARLTPHERMGAMLAALASMPDADRRWAWGFAMGDGAGAPSPPLFDPMTEALWWAELAEPAELRAYAVACHERMSPADRAAFSQAIRKDRP